MRIKNGIAANNGIINRNGIISNNGITISSEGGETPPQFCLPWDWLESDNTGNVTTSTDGFDFSLTLTDTNPGNAFLSSYDEDLMTAAFFTLAELDSKVWFEFTITGTEDPSLLYGIGFQNIPQNPFGGGALIGGAGGIGTGTILNLTGGFAPAELSILNGVPQNLPYPQAVGLTLTLPYTFQIGIDGNTGQVIFADSEQNFATLGVDTGFINNFIITRILGGSQSGVSSAPATISGTLNAGYTDPVITPPVGYKSWCSIGAEQRDTLCTTLVGRYSEGLEEFDLYANPDVTISQGAALQQKDDSYTITNNVGTLSQWVLTSTKSYDFLSQPGFIDFSLAGFSSPSSTNSLTLNFVTGLLNFLGINFVIDSFLENGSDGAISLAAAAFGGTTIGKRKILGQEFTLTKPAYVGAETFTFNHISGGSGSLEELGLQIADTVTPGIAITQGVIGYYDYNANPLTFEIQFGANPAATILLTSINADADALALDIQTQLQAAGSVYTDMTFVKSASGLDIKTGYSILIGFDPTNAELYYVDNAISPNTDTIDLNSFLVGNPIALEAISQLSLPYGVTGSVPASGTVEFRFNAGKYDPTLSYPIKYKGHCDIPDGNKLYMWVPLTGFILGVGGGNRTLAPDDIDGDPNRKRILTNDITESEMPHTVDLFSDQELSPTTFTVNCFESEITFYETGVIKQEFSVGLNAVLASELRLVRANLEGADINGINPIVPYGSELYISSTYPNVNDVYLANRLPEYQVGDAISVCVFNNPAKYDDGDDYKPVTPTIQLVIKIGMDTVIYDKLVLRNPGSDLPWVAFSQANRPEGGVNDNTPDGNRAEITFNGEDGTYTITDYPTDFLDYNGKDMTGSTTLWDRSAEYAPWSFTSDADRTVNYLNANKTLQVINGTTSNSFQAMGHFPIFLSNDPTLGAGITKSTLLGFKIDTLNGQFKLDIEGIQFENTKFSVYGDGATVSYDLYNDDSGYQGTFPVAGATFVNTGLVYVQFKQNIIDPYSFTKIDLFIYDGITVNKTLDINIGFQGFEASWGEARNWAYAILSGFTNLNFSETAQVTSQCKAADMDPIITALPEILANTTDLEGNPV